jgi:CBS domain-containing protein
MKVAQLMTPAPLACGPDSNLAEVAALMWDANCGIVPMVDAAGRVTGVVTDRDICIAAATRNLAPQHIRVCEVQDRPAVCCRPEDDVKKALRLMKEHRVRRLPVTGSEGELHGIVSIDDILLEAGHARAGFTAKDVISTLQVICARALPVPDVRTAQTAEAGETARPARSSPSTEAASISTPR